MSLPPWKLVAKTWARQRSRHREFRFRFRLRAPAGRCRLDVRARRGGFACGFELRRGGSDARAFEQVFLGDFYNLRGSPRGPELVQAFERRRRRRRPLIVDLGANIGLASLYLASQWPGARIVAVEPDAGNFAQLQRNFALSSAAAAEFDAVQAAVASHSGWARIANPGGPAAGLRTAAASAGAPGAIPALSLDELLARAPECEPFLVKIDIEGAEADLFQAGPPAWMARFPVLVVEPHDWTLPGSFRPCLQALAAAGRDILVLGESLVALAPEEN